MVTVVSEFWRDVPDFESLYEVSDMGRVRRKPNTSKRKEANLINVRYRPTRMFGSVSVWKENHPHYLRIDALVLCAFIGEQPKKTEIVHLNGDIRDNSLSNLAYQLTPLPAEKPCTKCGEVKPLTIEFFKSDPKQGTGFRPECRVCAAKYYRAYETKNRDVLNRKARERYAANPEKRLVINRRSVAKNPYRSQLAKHLSSQRRPRNKQKDVVKRLNRHARKLSLPNTFTSAQWQRAITYFNGCCAACGNPRGLWNTIAGDHWIALNDPRHDNPGSVATNIVPLCHPRKGIPVGQACCNTHKGDADPRVWLTKRFGQKPAHEIHTRIQAYFDWVREQDQLK